MFVDEAFAELKQSFTALEAAYKAYSETGGSLPSRDALMDFAKAHFADADWLVKRLRAI